MAKYSNYYLRNKKESNISSPLRFSFLRSVFAEHMTVKQAAQKWKIHYSTAKIIARLAKRSNVTPLFSECKNPTLPCGWKVVSKDRKKQQKKGQQKQSGELCESTDSGDDQDVAGGDRCRIQIVGSVGRVGWNYQSEVSAWAIK